MRSVFFGTPACAVPSLEALPAAGHDVPLVITQPDRPVGRSHTPKPPPVKEAALRHGLEVIQPRKIRGKPLLETIQRARPDVLVVVAYGRILPTAILEVARYGAVNVHFSLLPAYRGAAPVQWALANGETVTGVTTIHLNARMDEGDVLLSEEVAVEAGERTPALTARLAAVGADVLRRTLEGLSREDLDPTPQDHAKATYAPMIRKEDGEIDPAMTAREIEGRVRGFDPWPGVWLRRRGRRIRIVDAEAGCGPSVAGPPGRVLELDDDALWLACGEGSRLAIRAVQPEGRRAMTAREAVNGRQLLPGDELEGPARES